MHDELNNLLRRQDARAATELARVLAAAAEDVRTGWGDEPGH